MPCLLARSLAHSDNFQYLDMLDTEYGIDIYLCLKNYLLAIDSTQNRKRTKTERHQLTQHI